MKFAVYAIIVEDTQSDDERLGAVGEEFVRVAGDLTLEEAELLAADIREIPGANSSYWGDGVE